MPVPPRPRAEQPLAWGTLREQLELESVWIPVLRVTALHLFPRGSGGRGAPGSGRTPGCAGRAGLRWARTELGTAALGREAPLSLLEPSQQCFNL